MPNSKHSKAPFFAAKGLFSGLSVFTELEERIADLPEEKMRGDAFEVFAEAYLATQRKHDADIVWPLPTTPADILREVNLSAQDYGVDGIIKSKIGKTSVFQVKFRTGRPSLTWRELSTFIGLSDSQNIHSRILITNCDDLPSVLNERQGFFCIRGSDLDRLNPEDFRVIEAWLDGSAYQTPKKAPLPHQAEALEAVAKGFEGHSRVSAIMACGTGKTLVALWAVERIHATLVLVLVPSLALLRQTLHEWLRESSLSSLAYLCVCSDASVKDGVDTISTQQSDLDFEVSTDVPTVRGFLDTPFDGVKIVFSTYQSARIVGAAMTPEEFFDFAVFDEAHKTAGREGRNFVFALEDSNISIRRRLFLTATPRHYNPHQRDDSGDAQLVFSMDRPEVYGPQVFRLTFAEAARRGIICSYRIVISIITSEMVTNELLSRGEVIVEDNPVRARQVANQIALCDVIGRYGVNKVFTFHKTVESAASFVSAGSEGIRTHLPEFSALHVNGSMPTAERELAMRSFRSAQQAIMSNARCLTEGVDVPAVDMVAFLSPRRSRVDIVQATGRAMRLAPGKTTGYVLVPLYVELAADESVEDAVNRAEFDEVWDVLHSLQEQDEVLAELIREVGEAKGRRVGHDDSRLSDVIDFGGPRLQLEMLRATVTTRCLDNLCSSWDAWYGKLKAFKERVGHCNVETESEEQSDLRSWVSAQRTRRKKGTLGGRRIQLLDEIGFTWDFRSLKNDETWMKWYSQVEAYAKEHGHPNVPNEFSPSLAQWVYMQRVRRVKQVGVRPMLTRQQIELLDKLGFAWDAHDAKWVVFFEQFKEFKKQHGHGEPGMIEGSDELKKWISKQRQLNARQELNGNRKAVLDSVGFSWVAEEEDLHRSEMLERLRAYHSAHGHADVPDRWSEDPQLANWVRVQRKYREQGRLTDEKVRQLDGLGFTWRHHTRRSGGEQVSWEQRYEQLVAFKAVHGHCNVPIGYNEAPGLGSFVGNTRTQRRKGWLRDERVKLLDELGFEWIAPRIAKRLAKGETRHQINVNEEGE
jgi:superfamily II DNA or RNA helicase